MTDFLAASGLVLTVLLAFMQLQRTHRATLEAQEAHLRNQLKVDLYAKVAPLVQDAAESAAHTASDYQSVLSVAAFQLQGLPFKHLRDATALLEGHRKAANAVLAVISFLEQHEIVFARFGSIRRALSEAHERLLLSHTLLWQAAALLVPPAPTPGAPPPTPLAHPTNDMVQALQSKQEDYGAACSAIGSFMVDVQIEAQNELLGSLFQRELPPRNPASASELVLRRDDAPPSRRPSGGLV